MAVSEETRNILLDMQKSEITEYYIYKNIAKRVKDKKNKDIILKIAEQEKEHSDLWASYTKQTVKPKNLKVFFYKILSVIFGYTFILRYMEHGEGYAQETYDKISHEVEDAIRVKEEEDVHEQALIETLDEERLRYIRAVVLGLNDALVELTGALAGLSFALSNNTLISLSGLITGIAATLSMAASEYLSTKAEGRKDAGKSSFYTGTAYLVVVSVLILPYLLLNNTYLSLGIMLGSALLIILIFNYYISVALNLSFKARFFQMATISMGVAGFSFLVGFLLRIAFNIEI